MDPNLVSVFICTIPLKGVGGVPHDFPRGKKQNWEQIVGSNLPLIIRFKLDFTLNSLYYSNCSKESTILRKLIIVLQNAAATEHHLQRAAMHPPVG